MKTIIMPKPIESFEYIKCYSSSAAAQVAPELLKALAVLSDTTVRTSVVDGEDLKRSVN